MAKARIFYPQFNTFSVFFFFFFPFSFLHLCLCHQQLVCVGGKCAVRMKHWFIDLKANCLLYFQCLCWVSCGIARCGRPVTKLLTVSWRSDKRKQRESDAIENASGRTLSYTGCIGKKITSTAGDTETNWRSNETFEFHSALLSVAGGRSTTTGHSLNTQVISRITVRLKYIQANGFTSARLRSRV